MFEIPFRGVLPELVQKLGHNGQLVKRAPSRERAVCVSRLGQLAYFPSNLNGSCSQKFECREQIRLCTEGSRDEVAELGATGNQLVEIVKRDLPELAQLLAELGSPIVAAVAPCLKAAGAPKLSDALFHDSAHDFGDRLSPKIGVVAGHVLASIPMAVRSPTFWLTLRSAAARSAVRCMLLLGTAS
jgi:hypothetical protein